MLKQFQGINPTLFFPLGCSQYSDMQGFVPCHLGVLNPKLRHLIIALVVSQKHATWPEIHVRPAWSIIHHSLVSGTCPVTQQLMNFYRTEGYKYYFQYEVMICFIWDVEESNVIKQLEFEALQIQELLTPVGQVDCTMLSNKRWQFMILRGWRNFIDLADASCVPQYGSLNFQGYSNNSLHPGPVKMA